MKASVKALLVLTEYGKKVKVEGWVRNARPSKNVIFVHLNDGSTIQNIQIVADAEKLDEKIIQKIKAGAAISVTGELVASKGSEQASEVLAENIQILGETDASYPIQPKKHTLEFLRKNAHLRTRTQTFGAVFRLRHALAFAVHQFFHEKGFYYWNTPIITASDAEGAGEIFKVTTLDFNNPPKDEEGAIDFKEDFFGKATNLTVSGQLEGELGAMGLGRIYTFGPTFRAENSNTSRHLAEFWMIEPEIAFYDLKDNQDLAEEFCKYLIRFILENYKLDLQFLDARFTKENEQKPKLERAELGLIEKLEFVLENKFERITYTEAIQILLNSKPHKKKKFKFNVEWGIDLHSEHERFLVEKHFKKPVIITDYPKAIKAFYMRQNEPDEQGRETVAAMDVLFPGIGEIIGGSQREERYDLLLAQTEKLGITEELHWYLDTRKFGTVPHSGFGLGFERFVQFVTGMENIRDVIPFPRTPKNAEY